MDGLDADVVGAEAAAARRNDVAARVRDHAGEMARELALLRGGDYGRLTVDTDRGTWTLKYEAGDVQYLRFERGGRETYVVSAKQPPEPAALAEAMARRSRVRRGVQRPRRRRLGGALDRLALGHSLGPRNSTASTREEGRV